MKFSVARGELLEALSAASRALSARSTLPILSGILIEAASDGTLTIQSTDLEISIKQTLNVNVEREGSAVFPGKLSTDIVRSLPEAAITLEKEGETASLTCGTASFSMKTLSPDDFPRFPEVAREDSVKLDAKVFSSLVSHVSKAVSRDETRPILTGVLVVVQGPTFRMVATDSYRLAVKETVLEGDSGAEMEAVVPGKALDEIARLASSEDIAVAVSENQAVFSFGSTVFVTRRIEGSFPNWKQLIPKDAETRVEVDREEFAQAVKRVSLLAQHNTPMRLAVSAEDKTLNLSATTQDVGDASEDLMVSVEGEDVEIAFNHGFLSDGLATAYGDKVELEIVSPLKPGVIRAPADEGFLYLLMPVRLG